MLHGKSFDAAQGRPLNQQIEKLPVDVQRRVEAIQAAAKSNDWPAVRAEYDQINWRGVKKPAKVLKEISKDLKGNKDAKDLRREIKTKYELLREGDDADLEDKVATTPIPVVQYTVQKFPSMEIDQVELVAVDIPALSIPGLEYISLDINAIAIPGLKYTYLDIIKLDPKVLQTLGIVVPVIDSKGVPVVVLKIGDEKFNALMALWEKRYSKQLDFYDEQGNRLVPMPGTVLASERQAVISATAAGGDYDALWDAYNEHFQKSVGRRISLKKNR